MAEEGVSPYVADLVDLVMLQRHVVRYRDSISRMGGETVVGLMYCKSGTSDSMRQPVGVFRRMVNCHPVNRIVGHEEACKQ